MITKQLTIEGRKGAVTFDVAPTPVSKMAKCRLFLAKKEFDTEEAIEALLEAVFYGARRAGSQITLEWLMENVDQHNFPQVMNVFREVNLPKPDASANGTSPPAGVDNAGEAQAAPSAAMQ